MELKPERFKNMLPLPVTLITTINTQGVPNAAPYSCVMPVLRPLDLIAFASHPQRHTVDNIQKTGQFVINVMGRPSFEKAVRRAKPHPEGVNELEAEGMKNGAAKEVRPPRVQDAVGWIEAEMVNQLVEDTYVLIVGKVLCAEINDAYMKNGQLETLPILLNFPYFRDMGAPVAGSGCLLERSVINDALAKRFPGVQFEASEPEMDHAGDIDYLGKVGDKYFGIQIKPITANANFANYKISERMSASFQDFEEKYVGKVFIIFSTRSGNKKDIVNKTVIKDIESEIERLKSRQ